MVKKLNWKDDKGILAQRAEPGVLRESWFAWLLTRVVQGASSGAFICPQERGIPQMKETVTNSKGNARTFPAASTVWSSVQNSVGTLWTSQDILL